MPDHVVYGLIRGLIYFPGRLLSLFVLLWLLALIARSPRGPGFISLRFKVASWISIAWEVANSFLETAGSSDLARLLNDPILPSPPLGVDRPYAKLGDIRFMYMATCWTIHATLLLVLYITGRKPRPPAPPASSLDP